MSPAEQFAARQRAYGITANFFPKGAHVGYDYKTERQHVFTENGQKLFLAIRDKTQGLLKVAGAARLQEMIAGNSGDSWHMLACVDRLVELGEIRELTGLHVAGQHRVFVSTRE